MKYEVTIGIPVYSAEKYIERALLSALNQTFSNIEYIIVNDASVDNSISVIESIINSHSRGKDIRLINSPQNQGVAASRNIMIKEAQGKYLCFLDSDDEMTENAIQVFYDLMQEKSVDFIVGSYLRLNDNREILQEVISENEILINGEFKLAEAYFSNRNKKELIPIPVWNKFYDISFLRDNNILFPSGYVYEDSLFTYQTILKANSCRIIPDITYHYYIISSSITEQANRNFSRSYIDSCIHLIKGEKEICKEYTESPFFEELIMSSIASHYHLLLFIVRKRNKDKLLNQDIKIALDAYPLTLKRIKTFSFKNKIKSICFILISKLPGFIQRVIIKML